LRIKSRLLSLLVTALFSGTAAYVLPLGHPVYESLDFLIGQNLLPALAGNTKPYDARKAASALAVVDTLRLTKIQKENWLEAADYLKPFSKSQKENRLLLEIYLNTDNEYADSLDYWTRGCGGAAYSFGRFTLADRVSADLTDQGPRFDHLGREFKEKLPSDMPQAYLSYDGEHFGVLAGRSAAKWGPGKFGNLILGDHQPSMNMIFAWAKIGFLSGYTLSSKLDPLAGMRRYLSASRLVINATKNITLALNQSVVYARAGEGFELYYMLPSYVYYFSQFGFADFNETENTFVGADGEWRLSPQARLYFEFLADDFQVDQDPASRGVQNAVAWLVGADCPGVLGSLGGGAEYVRINSYTYKHVGGWPTHYVANDHGGIIGHRLGPDAEELNVWVNNRFSRHIQGRLLYTLSRTGDLNSVYGTWWAWGKADEPVPYGRVQNAHDISLEANLANYRGLSAGLSAGYRYVLHAHNGIGTEEGPRFRLRMNYYLGYLLSWDNRDNLFPLKK
jgi:hypothetical protein